MYRNIGYWHRFEWVKIINKQSDVEAFEISAILNLSFIELKFSLYDVMGDDYD